MNTERIKSRFGFPWFLSLLFISGLVLGVSDGPWFPLPNLLGASLLTVFGLLADTEKEAEVEKELRSCSLGHFPPGKPEFLHLSSSLKVKRTVITDPRFQRAKAIPKS